ncbi:hypothetical protein MHBO_002649 [Bonamia ostreae]|uniref:Uncharacterized protein n=1 Tax=Bonamia ostreae TaxID=126728 RepID=A0ABV2AN20_9EUKA
MTIILFIATAKFAFSCVMNIEFCVKDKTFNNLAKNVYLDIVDFNEGYVDAMAILYGVNSGVAMISFTFEDVDSIDDVAISLLNLALNVETGFKTIIVPFNDENRRFRTETQCFRLFGQNKIS